MRRTSFLIAFYVCSTGVAPAMESATWQQEVVYRIEARLDTLKHELTGTELIHYTNHSPDTLRKVYLLLYGNAFYDQNTTAMREARKYFLTDRIRVKESGWIRIDAFEILSVAGNSQLPLTAFHIRDTVLEAALPEPLPPGATLTLRLRFTEKIGHHNGRTGYKNGQYDIAQWFAKVAVYGENGWMAEPMHLMAEAPGEFARFVVRLDIPGNYILAATGVPVEGDPGWQWVQPDSAVPVSEHKAWQDSVRRRLYQRGLKTGYRSVTFEAERVHDFAWSASANFLYDRLMVGGLPIHLLSRPDTKKSWKQRIEPHLGNILGWLQRKFGPYPHPQITIVQSQGRFGLAFPMLLMLRSANEFSLSHGLGHFYFYDVLANNEVDEAWLSEGLNVFQSKWYMEERYGAYGYNKDEILRRAPFFLKWYKLPTLKQIYSNFLQMYISSGHDEPIAQAVHEFRDPTSFGMNAYLKGALFFDMLKYVVGDSVFTQICREYYRRWQFQFVNEERFRQVAESVSGRDLGWFFDQWLHNTAVIDYALKQVRKRKTEQGLWETTIQVENQGTGVMPVDILITSKQGDSLWHRWDGRSREALLTLRTPFKPDRVILDPKDAILDYNLLNNGRSRFEWRFDLPLQEALYQPRAAYLLLWRPTLGYNDPDGLRPGVRIRGSYRGLYRRFQIASSVGLRSRQVDVSLYWENALDGKNNDRRYQIWLQKKEGRAEARAELRWVKSRSVGRPPFHQFTVGWQYLHTFDPDYGIWTIKKKDQTVNYDQWEKGTLHRLYFRYRVDPRGVSWESLINFRMSLALPLFGGLYRYQKAALELEGIRRFGPFSLYARVFGGGIRGASRAPLQDQFYLDSASPLSRWMLQTVQSRGSNYRFALYQIGDGNVRGYVWQPVSGMKVVAATVEARLRLPYLPFHAAVFYDRGRLQRRNGPWLQRSDMGFSLLMDSRANSILPIFNVRMQLRYDFPVYLSHPPADEPKRMFRWSIGIQLN